MSLVKKNLEWLIAHHKTNPHRLVAEVNELFDSKLTQPTLHRILSGESQDPRTSTLQPLADFFGVSVNTLRTHDLAEAAQRGSVDVLMSKGPEGKAPAPAKLPNDIVRIDSGLDIELLEMVMGVFFDWIEANAGRVKIDRSRYATVIGVLYKYAAARPEATRADLQELLKIAA